MRLGSREHGARTVRVRSFSGWPGMTALADRRQAAILAHLAQGRCHTNSRRWACYELPMCNLSHHRHRFPAEVIRYAVWLYFRFPLSYRDVEDMLAERGIDVSYETVRRWAVKFGAIIARKLRRGRSRPDVRWHLDEVFVSINGRQLYVWRAVDSEGEVLDILVQPR